MSKIVRNPLLVMTIASAAAVGWICGQGQQPLNAAAANSNDRFSMATVPTTVVGDLEVVFVLDHLTGILRGGALNQNGQFAANYVRNVAADFQVNPATPDPKYSIVTGIVTLRSQGGGQPANGVVYVAELTSGAVVAYGFPSPRGSRINPAPVELVRLDGFQFREAVGG